MTRREIDELRRALRRGATIVIVDAPVLAELIAAYDAAQARHARPNPTAPTATDDGAGTILSAIITGIPSAPMA